MGSSSTASAGGSSDSTGSVDATGAFAATSGSASGLSLTGLILELVGETEIGWWETGGDDACGILQKD